MVLIGTIVVGFAMMTLGVGLLLVGAVPFIAGRRISATRSRLIGVVLVGFLPLAMAVRFATGRLLGPEAAEGPVITSFVFSFCCLATLIILFRVMFPKRPPRKPGKANPEPLKENPFGADEVIELETVDPEPVWIDEGPKPTGKSAESPKKAPAKKAGKPTVEHNPFDFN